MKQDCRYRRKSDTDFMFAVRDLGSKMLRAVEVLVKERCMEPDSCKP